MEFAAAKQKLMETLRAAKENGPGGKWYPHVAFGKLTPAEWSLLHHKHLDHHLRQFSA
jgi:hypothetical protein